MWSDMQLIDELVENMWPPRGRDRPLMTQVLKHIAQISIRRQSVGHMIAPDHILDELLCDRVKALWIVRPA